jgi:hypothetical protein
VKQYRITTADLHKEDPTDCYLSPDDPVHQLKSVSQLGGLGSEQALADYKNQQLPVIKVTNKSQIQKEQNIKPGCPEWFELWFGNHSET